MTSFVNNATHIEVWDGLTQLLNIPKSNCSFKKISGSSLCVFDFEHRKLIVEYSSVILPASANIDDLLVILNGYLLEWEAHENTLLTAINTSLSIISSNISNISSNNSGFSKSLAQAAQLGLISGGEWVVKNAARRDLTALDTEHVWTASPDSYTFPTSAAVCQVFSSSANDTSAGTGARTVFVKGLNGSFVEVSETVTMNGTSNVNTTNSYIRVNEFYILTSGSNATNVGNIGCRHTVTNQLLEQIDAGLGTGMGVQFTVPAGKKLLIDTIQFFANVEGASSQTPCRFRVYTRNLSNATYRMIFETEARGFISHKNTLPVLEGPCDIWATAATMVVLESTTNVYVNYQGFLHTP